MILACWRPVMFISGVWLTSQSARQLPHYDGGTDYQEKPTGNKANGRCHCLWQAHRHRFLSAREAMFPSQRLIWCRIPIQNSVLAVGTQQTAKLLPFDISARRTLRLHEIMVYVEGIQVKGILMFCLIFSLLNIRFKKRGIIQLPISWHNRFTMSSVVPSFSCLSAVFRLNDPVLAFLCRATSGRQTLFGICNVLFGYLWKRWPEFAYT